jgi:hypothetical protein
MEFGVCRWMVDSVQIVLFGVACGVGTDPVSQELLTFLHALRDVESDIRSWYLHRFARWRLPLRAATQMPPTGDACRGSPRQASSVDRASCCLRRQA